MTEDAFTQRLRELTRRKPFIPFVVEMIDGRRITVDHPSVAFGGGAAGFISDSDGLIDFRCEEVQNMTPIHAPPKEGQGMPEDVFFNTLRQFTRREPFVPFIVELLDGRRIDVDYPSVAFSGGAAGFINNKGILERFACEEVRSILLATAGAHS